MLITVDDELTHTERQLPTHGEDFGQASLQMQNAQTWSPPEVLVSLAEPCKGFHVSGWEGTRVLEYVFFSLSCLFPLSYSLSFSFLSFFLSLLPLPSSSDFVLFLAPSKVSTERTEFSKLSTSRKPAVSEKPRGVHTC